MERLINILDRTAFLVCGTNGNINPSREYPTGLFSWDTRFLSAWELRINGEPVSALSVDESSHFEHRFFLVSGKPTHYVDAKLSVIRNRFVSGNLVEELSVLNHRNEDVDVEVRINAESDFADIFQIKNPQEHALPVEVFAERNKLRFVYRRERYHRETVISSSEPAQFDERGLTFDIRIGPHEEWSTRIDITMVIFGPDQRDYREAINFQEQRSRHAMHAEIDEWVKSAPKLETDSVALATAYHRGLIDLAALRYTLPAIPGDLPAAGLPWFMAVFGRDSMLTSLQTLPFLPQFAPPTLTILAAQQGSRFNDFRDEEPGKILHEVRWGETAGFEEQPHSPYFGAADTTPLFVILLDEYEQWSGDTDLVRALEMEARAAISWIDSYGDLLGTGYISYKTRNPETGLVNQCWKDSWDSISYATGRLPAFPRATCELQGYAYDAKMRGARLARIAWNDIAFAERLEREAAELKERFNRDFWVADGEYYALALDEDGRQVDALSSNIGHLLWSGIVEDARAGRIAELLTGERLFSGWGVRTLATGSGRYNPLGYHVGTVWPFDNAIAAWGLARYGFREEAARISQAMLEAAAFFNGRLPEAFAGYDRTRTRYPVEYPTACSPQAWSSGTAFLLLRVMLGLQPHDGRLIVEPVLPSGIKQIHVMDIPGRWGLADAIAGSRD
ncbi:glycogen debranching N-terminal domain-containing protein [Micromonospora chersina]|uniref:amylo-alpha-1,6-glucosidase n=1 Tax=Micromonospora chersina TaxID=47854 RepID=UPI00371D4299